MNNKQNIRRSKFLSLLLRHKPKTIGLTLDDSGWAEVSELLEKLEQHGRGMSFEELQTIVTENDKQRFRFNEDQTRICASQGHSLKLDLQLKQVEPPDTLYHGTASRFLKSIMQEGLSKRGRHHVHLSADEKTAINVGTRHGFPVLLRIKAKDMSEAGIAFYLSENGVWLTESVAVKYIEQSEKNEHASRNPA